MFFSCSKYFLLVHSVSASCNGNVSFCKAPTHNVTENDAVSMVQHFATKVNTKTKSQLSENETNETIQKRATLVKHQLEDHQKGVLRVVGFNSDSMHEKRQSCFFTAEVVGILALVISAVSFVFCCMCTSIAQVGRLGERDASVVYLRLIEKKLPIVKREGMTEDFAEQSSSQCPVNARTWHGNDLAGPSHSIIPIIASSHVAPEPGSVEAAHGESSLWEVRGTHDMLMMACCLERFGHIRSGSASLQRYFKNHVYFKTLPECISLQKAFRVAVIDALSKRYDGHPSKRDGLSPVVVALWTGSILASLAARGDMEVRLAEPDELPFTESEEPLLFRRIKTDSFKYGLKTLENCNSFTQYLEAFMLLAAGNDGRVPNPLWREVMVPMWDILSETFLEASLEYDNLKRDCQIFVAPPDNLENMPDPRTSAIAKLRTLSHVVNCLVKTTLVTSELPFLVQSCRIQRLVLQPIIPSRVHLTDKDEREKSIGVLNLMVYALRQKCLQLFGNDMSVEIAEPNVLIDP